MNTVKCFFKVYEVGIDVTLFLFLCHTFHTCSKICLSVKMWSLQEFPLHVLLCCCLLVRLKSVIPLQLLLSDRFPFFTSFTIKPVLESSGIFLEIQISWKIFSRMVGLRDSTSFNSSVLMLTSPGDSSFFLSLMALISWIGCSSVSCPCLEQLQILGLCFQVSDD